MKDETLQLTEIKARLKTFFSDVKTMKDDQMKERIAKLQSDINSITGDPEHVPGDQVNHSGGVARFIQNRREQLQAPKLAAAEKVQHALDGFYKKLKQI